MFTRSDRLRPNTIFSRLSGTESDKSFVDDSDMRRGIVRMRVGLSYDLLRLSPRLGDLYDKPQNKKCAARNRPHPLNQTTLFHSHPHHRPPIQNIQNRTSPYTLKTPTASPYVLAADKSTGLPVHYRLQTTGLPAYF